MSSLSNRSYSTSVVIAEAVLKAALHTWNYPRNGGPETPPRVFVTISRQPGAAGGAFAHRLAERLNKEPDGDWSAWDDELLNKVSAEHGIAKYVIAAVDQQPQNWFEQFAKAISTSDATRLEESHVYQRVAKTIRALATAGHTVIVGRGGQFVTSAMPAAIHVRLVAPLEYRIKQTAARHNVPLHAAAKEIAEAEHNRKNFYARYWPSMEMTPESFTITLNMAEASPDELVESVVSLIRKREAPAPTHGCAKCQKVSATAAPTKATTDNHATPLVV